MFCKKGALKNLAKFTGKHLCQSLFFNKVAGLVNFTKFLRTPFLQNTSRRLLLQIGDGADDIRKFREFGKVENLRQKHVEESISRQVFTISKFIKYGRHHRHTTGKVFVIFGRKIRQFTPRITAAAVRNRR